MLEMGEPVRIIDLARNMIRLAGYGSDAEIAIEIVGVRPEKIHEELFNDGERSQQTSTSGSCERCAPDLSIRSGSRRRSSGWSRWSPPATRRPRGARGGADGGTEGAAGRTLA